MAEIDINPQVRSLLGDAATVKLLPPELQDLNWWKTSSNILDAVAEVALNPRLTDRIFAHFASVFADISARWVLTNSPGSGSSSRAEQVIAAFARILPFSPYLSVFLENHLRGRGTAIDDGVHPPKLILQPRRSQPSPTNSFLGHSHETDSLGMLLSIWRLISFDRQTYSCLAPARIEILFKHPQLPVRYLAIRIFCQLFSASDFALEGLLREHIGEGEPLEAAFDGEAVDYMFLTLFEHARTKKLHQSHISLAGTSDHQSERRCLPQVVTSFVVSWGRTLIPRPAGVATKPSSLILTPTTVSNLEGLARSLQKPGPILLHGLAGSGKTSLVQEAARELGMASKLVTLHLNEQTDAKMLIGLYTTGSKPGSFEWRAGILTTAVKEGRWVLIEDLDRAPTEVMSTLLPLIERGELLIPNRADRIRAPSSFRIFATVRTSLGMDGRENMPSFLGQRFWQFISVQQLSHQELQQIIHGTLPLVQRLAPSILSVFEGLSKVLRSPSSGSGRGSLERPINARDLFKWGRRLGQTLASAGGKIGNEPVSDTTVDYMFMEAMDCFLGSVKDLRLREFLARRIGHEMHMSTERVTHILQARIPNLDDAHSQLSAGRAVLQKISRPNRNWIAKSRRPFASTVHARRLLEQVSVAVKLREPVLLVGETGIGKTTVVQQLADMLGHKLVAVNLSQQSEVGDLLGGFKPVNPRSLAMPLKEEFEDLFAATGISMERNQKYLGQISKSLARGKWADVSRLWREAPKMFEEIVKTLGEKQRKNDMDAADSGQPTKRRKTRSSKLDSLLELKPRWDKFSNNLEQFDIQVSSGSGVFAFAFSEGNIIKAVRNGDWVLLDEINLASPDTLESIADLLQSGPNDAPSILLSETGEIERIKAHPNFRIFAAMNPATDVGKRDLPLGLRSRFTEFYVGSPDKDVKDLIVIIKTYLKGNNSTIDKAADRVANLYLAIKKLAEEKSLVDGANEVPHFSLRTLTRVLTYVNDVSPTYGLYRSLYEGFCMGFLTLLDRKSENLVLPLITDRLSEASPKPPRRPEDGKQYVKFVNNGKDRQYWLLQGGENLKERPDYIRTNYVERNLLNLVRATSTRKFPILIQGPTSSGKTSMIEYLANYSGNKFVRINNHEHTDLQEYLGTYVSGLDGKLRFQDGVLVQAMRRGSWIVLDELNLAPTDVLEALNRLLDDNRELLIPETQEIVRPHENFMLFATQNPPGLYGGRKVLSRAFRNRFLELHFDDIPEDELEEILQRRCRNTSPPDCRRIVTVYKELSRLRQTSRIFEQKDSFATLRDLFRWAFRDADNREEVAQNGYMLLAERVRNEEERLAVKGVIETVFKVPIDPQALYDGLFSAEMKKLRLQQNGQNVIWTGAMRRLFVLVSQSLRKNEPVILVGETGCGKTTVCQVLAEALGKELHIVNAHQNTETGDLIGSQRPVRNRGAVIDALKTDLAEVVQHLGLPIDGSIEGLLQQYHGLLPDQLAPIPHDVKSRILSNETRSKALFEWSDGSLVQAMKRGSFFLLDEISLADDSVLERLNSALEPQRTLLLAEKGIDDHSIEATEGFQFLATMNPGGDFGKKELSPALRNRFTEIWVPPLSDKEDVLGIVVARLHDEFRGLARPIVDFSYWFGKTFRSSSATAFSIRDILVWVSFINRCSGRVPAFALVHGAATVFIDTLGANPSALVSMDHKSMAEQRRMCLDKLGELVDDKAGVTALYTKGLSVRIEAAELAIGDFTISRVRSADDTNRTTRDETFAFEAPTTKLNAMRVVRALQISKPILLEGNPGVGKTTLVGAIAQACGRPLTRINLSDQTDLMDLFGTDVPVEGAEAGNFAWRDAPFLQAMQKGEWVLLDEMNLASQSVLEGLNACLDHRGEVYISELDQVFKCHPDFRLFAAQNPHQQGGGRKGLPSSFVNRFVVVYADIFTEEDQMVIASKRANGAVSSEVVGQIIGMISELDVQVVDRRAFGSLGSPWEFNLRDTLRWLQLLRSRDASFGLREAHDFLDVVVRQRFRTKADREEATRLFRRVFKRDFEGPSSLFGSTNPLFSHVGNGSVQRSVISAPKDGYSSSLSLAGRRAEVESLLICVKQNLPCILVGPSGSGKSALLQHVSSLAGKDLVIFHLNADVDTMDLVGGFEQSDPVREVLSALADVRMALQAFIFRPEPLQGQPLLLSSPALKLIGLLDDISGQSDDFDFGPVIAAIQNLVATGKDIPADSGLGRLLERAFDLLHGPLTLENPRFEWFDGVIVRAAQRGAWLVLDNANLCSASVLDRLNSLLERPAGLLSINEHTGPDGEPRVVTPHPEFRVFLTMDPRHGELSRAMRNRSVEIFVDLPPPRADPYLRHVGHVEASMLRYHEVVSMLGSSTPSCSSYSPSSSPLSPSQGASWVAETSDVALLAVDSLSLSDMSILERFCRALGRGLLASDRLPANFVQHLGFLVSYVQAQGSSSLASTLGTAVFKMYGTLESLLPPTAIEAGRMRSLVEMQPLHPLQDSAVAALLDSCIPGIPQWLAVCFETYLDACAAEEAMKAQQQGCNITKPSSLSRFQRSCIAKQVASVSKDSTAGVAGFLARLLEAVKHHIATVSLPHPAEWVGRRNMLRALLHYWWRTFRYVSAIDFEEASFQAHLMQGAKLFDGLAGSGAVETSSRDLISAIARDFQAAFEFGFRLSTGLSMEILWNLFRPVPLADSATFSQVVEMERLALRFDSLRWRAGTSPADLEGVTTSLVKVYAIVRRSTPDAESLLKAVQDEIAELESKTGESEGFVPVLSQQFESLRRMVLLHGLDPQEQEERTLPPRTWMTLCDLPTVSQMRFESSPSGPSRHLQAVDHLLCQTSDVHPWSGTASSSLLRRLESIRSETLSSLRSLELELPLMGHALATTTGAISADPIRHLNRILWGLLGDVAVAHGARTREELAQAYDQMLESLREPSLVVMEDGVRSLEGLFPHSSADLTASVMNEHILPAMVALAASNKFVGQQAAFSSVGWVQFAVGCMKLYVPDKIFDPHLRAKIEKDSHEELLASLQRRLSALEEFDRRFADGPRSMRTKLMREEIESVGDNLPSVAEQIYRQYSQEHSRVQAEFNNVLSVVVKRDVASIHFRALAEPSDEAIEGLQLLGNNISQLIARLSNRSAAYQDMTVPVVNFLRCLQVGISLTECCRVDRPTKLGPAVEGDKDEDKAKASWASPFLKVAPMLGGSLWRTRTDRSTLGLPTNCAEFLSVAKTYASVEGVTNLSSEAQQSVFECFHFLYREWSKKLASEQRATEAKSSLYRFRGSYEDEEEHDQAEFDELFPDYTAEDGIEDGEHNKRQRQQNKQQQHRVRDLSVQLTQIHKEIFMSPESPVESLHRLCKDIGQLVAKEDRARGRPGDGDDRRGRDKNLLAATLLIMDEKLKVLDGSDTATAGKYNFYTDANIAEARKLVELVHRIQHRFQELQGVDEIGHLQPLGDVVGACKHVLDLGYAEPLAKMLPPVEKLHEFLYEWQFRGYASRQHSAPVLYDKLTGMIVSWRRLELTTWAGLLDSEAQKCRDDANSWWFVAYQAVIAGPLSLLEKEEEVDLREHAGALLQELEQYFANSIVGEFAARLGLLRQLQAHLDLLAVEHPALCAVQEALRNFVSFHGRFERRAAEAVQRARAPLEKRMKDVLLMASWKDTNIAALRESSRRSHLKLFRLVRKFRAVLGQPMRPIIVEQGLPDDLQLGQALPFSGVPPISGSCVNKVEVEVDAEAIRACQQQEQQWGRDLQAIRLSRAEQFVGKMAKLGKMPDSSVPAFDLVEEFLSELGSSVVELRKETPSLLTEENKEQVKHLKTRKVKLFNDTLKTVRQMGFSRNLGGMRLARQKSTSVVLAGMKSLPRVEADPFNDAVEYQLDRLVDMAPKWRNAVHEHHGDLSRDAIQRSAGYLEGMLFESLQQRKVLVDASWRLQDLVTVLDSASAIVSCGRTSIRAGSEATAAAAITTITAVKQCTDIGRVLKWLVQILKLSLHLVGVHSTLGRLDNRHVQESLQQWVVKFSALVERHESLPQLPQGLTCSTALEIREQAQQELQTLVTEMAHLSGPGQREDLAFILEQISLWTAVDESAVAAAVAVHPPAEANPSSVALPHLYDEVLITSQNVLSAIQNFAHKTSALPTSADDPSWLINYSTGVSTALKSLRMETVTAAVSRCFETLKGVDLDSPSESKAAVVLFKTALPILRKYQAICRQTLSELARLHSSTCRMGHQLGKSFLDVASHGFCMPQEKSDEKSNDQGKMEGGTGLGDGQGAENISKDIGPDEDLSELAQEPNKEQNKDDLEEEGDAVDMGADELEGDLHSVGGEEDKEDGGKSGDEEDGEGDDIDEQAGDVDDLDPTAVDEKMWNDERDDEADKDQQGDSSKGKQQKDDKEQVAAATDAGAAKEAGGEEGQEQEDEQVGDAAEQDQDHGQDQEMGEEVGPDQEEAKPQEELNRQDQNVQESEALALPEEMDLDLGDDEGDESGSSDDDLDDLPEVEDDGHDSRPDLRDDDESESGENQEMRREAVDMGDETDGKDEQDEDGQDVIGNEDQINEDVEPLDTEGEDEDGDEKKPPAQTNIDQNQADQENTVPSEVKDGGGGQDQMDDTQEENADDMRDKAGQRERGDISEATGADQDAGTSSSKGMASSRNAEEAPQADDDGDDQDPADNPRNDAPPPFKKLGDLLEKWYRNNRDIRDAPKDKEAAGMPRPVQDAKSEEAAKLEFEHLQDENAPADTQALGAAADDEARPVDDSMAIDNDMEAAGNTKADKDMPQLLPDVSEEEGEDDDNDGDEAMQDAPEDDKDRPRDRAQGRSGVTTRQGAYNREESESPEAEVKTAPSDSDGAEDSDEAVQETSTQLSATHLVDEASSESPRPQRDLARCIQQWTAFQAKTHPLSLSLTSQLRLILTPSQSTKLSGSYRTGKRLNIKKIIPYIASGYKRDKIWMRRSVPTKRAYQILLCVDDSLSMRNLGGGDPVGDGDEDEGDKGAGGGMVAGGRGALALESLVMVSRALAMLEVGQVGVLGFGADVFAAHDLAEPFASAEAGGRALARFDFRQDRTDVALLVRAVVDRFREARLRGGGPASSGGSGREDLWQLALVLSDGLTPSAGHERVRRLLREAVEERIMVVFIVLDDPGHPASAAAADPEGNNGKGPVHHHHRHHDSVLDLNEARFVKDEAGNSKVVIERYLDTFPFPYYLIVHHLDDLPGALASLLRTWFAEVNS